MLTRTQYQTSAPLPECAIPFATLFSSPPTDATQHFLAVYRPVKKASAGKESQKKQMELYEARKRIIICELRYGPKRSGSLSDACGFKKRSSVNHLLREMEAEKTIFRTGDNSKTMWHLKCAV